MKYIIIVLFLSFGFSSAKVVTYKVKKGDSFSKIASKFLGKSKFIHTINFVKEIKKENSLKRLPKVGKDLSITLLDKSLKTKRLKKPEIVKALYFPLGSATSTKFLKRVKTYKKAGINTVVIDIKTMSGIITIPFKNKLKSEIKGKKHWRSLNLRKLLYYLHQENIYVIVRMVAFHDIIMADAKKEFRVFKKGKHRKWVNPENEEVQNYLLALVDRVLKYPIDELQLDYIRFPAKGAKSCKTFDRSKVILNFLKKVHKKTKKANILLGVDVFGIALWSGRADICNLGQNLRRMANYVDVISPMIYPSHFSSPFRNVENPGESPKEMIAMSMRRVEKLFKNKEVEIRPYLQGFRHGSKNYDENFVINQIDALKGRGYIFWSAVGKYNSVAKGLYLIDKRDRKKNRKKDKLNNKNIFNNKGFKKSNIKVKQEIKDGSINQKSNHLDQIMNDILEKHE